MTAISHYAHVANFHGLVQHSVRFATKLLNHNVNVVLR
jgi:hypothetical protein